MGGSSQRILGVLLGLGRAGILSLDVLLTVCTRVFGVVGSLLSSQQWAAAASLCFQWTPFPLPLWDPEVLK